ncbi:Retrovirus-related Pol poly, partial [Paramuricea clavata]
MAALQLPTLAPFSVLSDSATLSQRWTKWVKSFEYFLVASNVTDKKRQRALMSKSWMPTSNRKRISRLNAICLDKPPKIPRKRWIPQQIEGTKNSESDAEKSSAYVIQPRSNTNSSREFRSERPAASPQRQDSPSDDRLPKRACYCCGRDGHRAKDASCPANNKACNKCGKLGYFGRVCKSARRPEQSERVRYIEQRENNNFSDDDEYVFTLNDPKNSEQQTSVTITVHGTEIPVIIDSGAGVNVLDKNTFNRLYNGPQNTIKLSDSRVKLFSYGAVTPLPVLGKFDAMVTILAVSGETASSTNAQFIVVNTIDSGCLLGKSTAIALGLLRIGLLSGTTLNAVTMQSDVEVILSKYPTVFSGVVVDKKITELEDLDFIESVQGPTHWVSSLVAVPKANGEVRVCVDMRRANEAVIRERHPIPTLEETVQALNGATVFSKLDLRWGYHQIELHPDSRGLTTFSTPQGLKRYKRLIFGLSSASEMYQFVIQQVLIGIPGVRNISDDIIVFGTTQAEHDRSLDQTLQRLHANGLTLNKDKCLFSVPELVFFGFKISAAGLSPDDKKVEAIQPMPGSLTSDCVMAHYNPESETETEREALAVVWGCEKFHLPKEKPPPPRERASYHALRKAQTERTRLKGNHGGH